jgi:hypothetical protein
LIAIPRKQCLSHSPSLYFWCFYFWNCKPEAAHRIRHKYPWLVLPLHFRPFVFENLLNVNIITHRAQVIIPKLFNTTK